MQPYSQALHRCSGVIIMFYHFIVVLLTTKSEVSDLYATQIQILKSTDCERVRGSFAISYSHTAISSAGIRGQSPPSPPLAHKH